MANSRTGNVLFVDTTATFDEQLSIEAIKYVGADTSSVVITSADSESPIWEEAASTNVINEVCISAKNGITVTVTGTAKAYIYLA